MASSTRLSEVYNGGHDDVNRIAIAAAPTGTLTYDYDKVGRRKTLTDPDTAAVTTNTYDAANRLLTSEDANGVTTYTYDANGNQLTIEEPTGEVTTNVWDGENRLVAVEHPDFTVTSYAYNADGLKIEKDDGVQITRFLYDGNNLLRELDDLGTVEAGFTYVPQPKRRVVERTFVSLARDRRLSKELEGTTDSSEAFLHP